MIIQITRFKSGLSFDEVNQRFRERSGRYRKVPGLKQKYYVKFTETGEYGGIYLWDSPEALDTWREGNLSETIAETYQVESKPARQIAEVMLVLHDDD
ncbi:MAG TPA: hypothetical protein VKA26_01735 [Ignavibacteriaceae bacterium]|nr:hypothetical protein [Ignavibacteriaceae bacterium]